MSNSAMFDEDFYAWANEQAGLLRAGKVSEADIGHIAEEIESMGRAEKRALVNRLKVLLLHLLKWQVQPGGRSNRCEANLARETFPASCPWTFEQMSDRDYWPVPD